MTLKHHHIWLDLETTGVDPQEDLVLEWCAVLATDAPGGDFSPVQIYGSTIAPPEGLSVEDIKAACDPFVQDMHAKNGLWADVAEADATIEEVDDALAALCEELGAKPRSILLAGYSVHFDLGFCRVHLPKFSAYLSHRVFDVSVLRRCAAVYGKDYREPDAIGTAHRAEADVRHSLAQARAVLAMGGFEVSA